jgi:hypothetical protein
MPTTRRLASQEAIELLADAYSSPESGYKRTANGIKASYDGAILLFGMLDELRAIRQALESQAKR